MQQLPVLSRLIPPTFATFKVKMSSVLACLMSAQNLHYRFLSVFPCLLTHACFPERKVETITFPQVLFQQVIVNSLCIKEASARSTDHSSWFLNERSPKKDPVLRRSSRRTCHYPDILPSFLLNILSSLMLVGTILNVVFLQIDFDVVSVRSLCSFPFHIILLVD